MNPLPNNLVCEIAEEETMKMVMRESMFQREDSHVKGLREKTESESLSVVSDSCNPMEYPVHGILQARVLEPFPSPGDLPNPGIEPRSPAL